MYNDYKHHRVYCTREEIYNKTHPMNCLINVQ